MESISLVRVEYENIGESVVKIIHLRGKITAVSCIEINNKLKSLFDDRNYNVIVNIGDVEYMDSKGMALLLTLAKTVDQNGGKLILAAPSEFVHELLELTNLSSFFNISINLETARGEFE